MRDWLREIRFAVRALANDPGFTVPMVLTFAFAVGINSAAFGLASALMFRPIPVAQPDRIVQVAARSAEPEMPWPFPWSYPDFVDYAIISQRVFSGVALIGHRSLNLERGGRVDELRVGEVSGDFVGVMGMKPVLGRGLAVDYGPQPTPDYSVLAVRSFWQGQLASSPIGSNVILNHHLFTLVGVVDSPVLTQALGNPQIFVPASAMAAVSAGNRLSSRRSHWARVFARLKPGVSLSKAQAVVDLEANRLAAQYPYPGEDGGLRLSVVLRRTSTLSALINPDQASVIGAAKLLWALCSLLLILACANCANLSLTRGIRRLHEFAVRTALGAGTARLAGQLIAESLLICLGGAALGCALGLIGLQLLRRFPEIGQFGPTFDARVMTYAAVLTAAATFVFGLAPLGAALNLTSKHLQVRPASPTRIQRRFRRVLGILQAALSIILLVSAGTLLHSLLNLSKAKLGFDPSHLMVADMNFSNLTGSPGQAPSRTVLDRLRRDVEHAPGVLAVTFATATPLEGVRMTEGIRVPGYVPRPGEDPTVRFVTVADNYFRVVGAPILRGRDFETIPAGENDWVVISGTVARRYWPNHDPIGREIFVEGRPLRIAGVVQDVQEDGPAATPVPLIYYRYPTAASAFTGLLAQTAPNATAAGPEGGILQEIRRAVPDVPQPVVETVSHRLRTMLVPQTNIAVGLTALALLALLLASIGLFSVISYDVTARRQEFAIRSVVGASSGDLFKMVIRQGLAIAGWGMVAGSICSVLSGVMLQHFLFHVSLVDPPSFAGALSLFCVIAILAIAVPARRAALSGPALTLREE